MKKVLLIALLISTLALSGCALLLAGGAIGTGMVLNRKNISQATDQNRKNLLKLSLGLSKEETLEIMGTTSVRAYQKGKTGKVIEVTNPYRTEILQANGKKLEVIYYVTDVKGNDFEISDDELTPLVFEDGKLIGWGRSFIEENIQKYEIRFR